MDFDYASINFQKQNRNKLPYKLFNCVRDFPCDQKIVMQVLFARLLMNKNKVRNYLLMANLTLLENKS